MRNSFLELNPVVFLIQSILIIDFMAIVFVQIATSMH